MVTEWISVEDALPEFTGDFGGFALVSDDVKVIDLVFGEKFADYSTHGWCDDDGCDLNHVTHWRHLTEEEKQ